MSDISFLSLIAMLAVGVWLGRRKTPLNRSVAAWTLASFVAFYILAGIVLVAT